MAQNKLDLRQVPGGMSFYIDGSLQFDTRDEFIYHEMLVIPAASLLSLRTSDPFRALILGGGDGLALREILKYDSLKRVDLIDYDPAVVRYGKKEFALWNQKAFQDKRAVVTIAEAGRYLRSCRKAYDLIVADFTFPDDLSSCRLFTEEFYTLVKRCLSPKGFVAVNTVSPELSSPAFWSIFKTLSSLALHPRPLRVPIPSFESHGYGEWGFFLASPSPILSREIKNIKISVPAKYLKRKNISESMKFPKGSVLRGMSLAKVLKEPSDLLCFLNMPMQIIPGGPEFVDFSSRLSAKNVKWLGMEQDLAVSGFTPEWYERMVAVLRSLDWETFFNEVEKNIKGGFRKLNDEFKMLRQELPELLREKVFQWRNLHKLVALLVVLIVFINTVYPDNAYAKGYYGGGHYSHTGTNSTYDGPALALMAPVAVAAFHGLGKNDFVPDVRGGRHGPKMVALLDGAGIIRKKALCALADDIYISESGEIWASPAGLPYYYQIEENSFTLLEAGQGTPVFTFAPDPNLARLLLGNLELQQKALDKTVGDYEKWLAWAQPAGFLSGGIREEAREVRKLKDLRKIFSDLKIKLSGMASFFGGPEPASSVLLLPGVYLSRNGNLLLRKANGSQTTCSFRGFEAEPGVPAVDVDKNLARFLETAISWVLLRSKVSDPVKQILRDKMKNKEPGVAAWN